MTKFTNSKGEPIADREGLRAVIKDKFFKIGQIIDNAKASEAAYNGELVGIGKLSSDYNEAFISAKKQAAQNDYSAKKQALYSDWQKQNEELGTALDEIHGQFVMTPELHGTVDEILRIGKNLEYDSVLAYNSQFAGNQPALRIIRAAYKTADVAMNGGLDKQIYDHSEAIQELDKYAYAAFTGDGFSFFRLGVEAGKIAKLENVDFPQGDPFPSQKLDTPPTVDLGKVTDAFRAAAGLPPEGSKGSEGQPPEGNPAPGKD